MVLAATIILLAGVTAVAAAVWYLSWHEKAATACVPKLSSNATEALSEVLAQMAPAEEVYRETVPAPARLQTGAARCRGLPTGRMWGMVTASLAVTCLALLLCLGGAQNSTITEGAHTNPSSQPAQAKQEPHLPAKVDEVEVSENTLRATRDLQAEADRKADASKQQNIPLRQSKEQAARENERAVQSPQIADAGKDTAVLRVTWPANNELEAAKSIGDVFYGIGHDNRVARLTFNRAGVTVGPWQAASELPEGLYRELPARGFGLDGRFVNVQIRLKPSVASNWESIRQRYGRLGGDEVHARLVNSGGDWHLEVDPTQEAKK